MWDEIINESITIIVQRDQRVGFYTFVAQFMKKIYTKNYIILIMYVRRNIVCSKNIRHFFKMINNLCFINVCFINVISKNIHINRQFLQ